MDQVAQLFNCWVQLGYIHRYESTKKYMEDWRKGRGKFENTQAYMGFQNGQKLKKQIDRKWPVYQQTKN
jgi:hypothetical protein